MIYIEQSKSKTDSFVNAHNSKNVMNQHWTMLYLTITTKPSDDLDQNTIEFGCTDFDLNNKR